MRPSSARDPHTSVGLFDRLKERLTRTRTAISDGITGLFRGGRPIDQALFDELEELLYTSDLGPVAAVVTAELARRHTRGEIKGEDDVRAALKNILLERLDQEGGEIDLAHKPTVILVVGVNGSGKTTSIAKLGARYKKMGKHVVLGAGDTFRAAAADQLEIWAARNGADIVRHKDGADPAAVAYDAVDRAIALDVDVVLIDTAGRLHTQKNLMAELDKMRRVIERRLPGAPHETWLVLDGTNGQNAIQQARQFTAAVDVTGLIIAKLDGTARGGAVFGIKESLGLPVRYIGTGEQLELLEVFEPKAFVDAIVGSKKTLGFGSGSFLRNDFAPQITGAGFAALATLPAAALLIVRRATPEVGALSFFLLPLMLTVGWISFGGLTDTLEASRVVLGACTGLVMLLGGASLRARGRHILACGSVSIAFALVSFALFDERNGFAGALGNTGTVAEAALAGALIGAGFCLHEKRAWRVLGAATLLAFIAYTVRVPVLAGALALATALLFAAIVRVKSGSVARLAFAAIALAAALFVLVPVARRKLASGAETPAASAAQSTSNSERDPGNTGGIEVRARIWKGSLALVRDQPWLGIGPGQFAARFPPYRDPREIEISTLGRTLASETEVEHAHNDWLGPVLDAGAIFGLAWLVFLGAVAWSAAGHVRKGDATCAALGLAAIGVLCESFVNAGLTGNPTASCLAFAIFGVMLARESPARVPISRRFVPLGAAALLATSSPRAFAMVEHGRALAVLSRAADDSALRAAAATANDAHAPKPEITAGAAENAIEAAIEACPDSVLARTLHVRLAESQHRNPAILQAEWLRILALRPHRIEALMQLGLCAIANGEPSQAREHYERALELDRSHPGVLRNLASLELEDGEIEAGLGHLDALDAVHPPARDWLVQFAARLYLRGLDREAEAVLGRADPALITTNGEEAYARAKHYRQSGSNTLADAFECNARRIWAREQVESGHPHDAVRSYRQALRIARDYVEDGPPRLRLELAAAQLAEGKDDEARTELGALAPSSADWQALPPSARDRLRATGWFAK